MAIKAAAVGSQEFCWVAPLLLYCVILGVVEANEALRLLLRLDATSLGITCIHERLKEIVYIRRALGLLISLLQA